MCGQFLKTIKHFAIIATNFSWYDKENFVKDTALKVIP